MPPQDVEELKKCRRIEVLHNLTVLKQLHGHDRSAVLSETDAQNIIKLMRVERKTNHSIKYSMYPWPCGILGYDCSTGVVLCGGFQVNRTNCGYSFCNDALVVWKDPGSCPRERSSICSSDSHANAPVFFSDLKCIAFLHFPCVCDGELLTALLRGDASRSNDAASKSPTLLASAIVWAFMGKALEKGQGFQEGTLVT